MKNTVLLLLFVIFGLVEACSDNDEKFGVTMPLDNIRFKPIEGGAIMYYNVPNNSDVFSIQAVYTDGVGNHIVKLGSYVNDSLELTGFNEGQESVPVAISLRDRYDRESDVVYTTFSTLNSAPVAFFDKVDVQPYWNGFQVHYEGPKLVEGFANVFFIGTNPMTKKLDTLLLKTVPIKSGKDTLLFTFDKGRDYNTIVIRTEDFRGNTVKQQIWENVEAYNVEKLDPTNFVFEDPFHLSYEDEEKKTGVKYLFDGDTKGTQRFLRTAATQQYTFIAGPYAVGKYWILDIKERQLVSNIRLYGVLNTYTWPNDGSMSGSVWGSRYYNRLPNEVTIYASNDESEEKNWVKVAYCYESPVPTENSWMDATRNAGKKIDNIEDLEAADPAYMSINFPILETTYRFFKIEVNSTFDTEETRGDKNGFKNVTFHEIEVYAKKN